ncbi:MAG TPA: response regulator [Acidimicrobiales bacterium]|nr:response regulator [Acidimicrobiales bacterium]
MATVLVVDDEADLRELVKLNLSLEGHRVVGAADGDEALDVAGQESPDVILLDVMMPKRDGWDTLGAIKAGGMADIPVLMLTARSDELDQVKGAIEGAIQYITKPFSLDTLRHAVDQALAGGPEPVQRRQVQEDALRRLARMERGAASLQEPPIATPRLTRLESRLPPARSVRAPSVPRVTSLSKKQYQLIEAVASTQSVTEAAEQLGVSRSYVYASLRRIARKLGIRSGPELIGLARQGTFPDARR